MPFSSEEFNKIFESCQSFKWLISVGEIPQQSDDDFDSVSPQEANIIQLLSSLNESDTDTDLVKLRITALYVKLFFKRK